MSPRAEPALAVHDVSKAFRGVAAVNGASFSVAPRSITALIGPNGAGKTTMFDLISGFLRPDAGNIVHDGQVISGRRLEQTAGLGLVRTFQLTRTFLALTVLDNMLVGSPRHPGERLASLLLRPRRAWRTERLERERAEQLLDAFALADQARALAGTLSGGQRKLLELARALMARPRTLLLDEPMAGVNPTMGIRLLEHVRRVRDDHGVTVLFIEHDLEAVIRYSEHVIVMAGGAVIADGTPELIRRDRRVLDAYLGLGKAAPTAAAQVPGARPE
ncbi:MAG: ABC transporter ATP-binding protein [Solirubrobacterales bacterium]|nr:ABC transporter ATP-binding protein [Solirubrobacterales bacterium]